MCIYLYKRWRRSKPRDGSSSSKEEPSVRCEHGVEAGASSCPQCKASEKAANRYRWKLIAGLFWPFALAALDATIIASALPWIAKDFNELSQLNWIVSAFNLTAAAFIPCWGQMADVFGRTYTINAAVLLMMIGSALCTAAPTSAFPMLLVGRSLQGIAAAGINVSCRVILADKVSLTENAKNWAVFSLIGGASYGLGPVIGGYITNADYRWCFAINLPVGAVALVLTFLVLRKELLGPQPIPELDETTETGRRTKFVARLKTIDYGGQVLFILGFGLIILALTWGGVSYPWGSAAVITSLVLGCVFVGAMLFYERSFVEGNYVATRLPWQRPMIPWSLITCRDIGLLLYTECITGMGMFAVLYFCNIYFTLVKGYDSDKAGTQLLYYLPGLSAGVLTCPLFTTRWPRNTFAPILLGTVVEAVGLGMLAWACWTMRDGNVFGFMAVVGYGCGLRFMAAPLHAVGLFRKNRAAVVALLSMTIPFGGTIGLTIMSTVFNNTSGIDSKQGTHGTASSTQASEAHSVNDAKMGVVWAFVAVTPFAVLSIVCACFLGAVKLGQGTGNQEDGSDNIVVKEVYLLTLVRGNDKHGERVRSVEMSTPPTTSGTV